VKAVRTPPKYTIIDVRGLILIYVLLCILTILFTRFFFSKILQDGEMPGRLDVIIFFTMPGVLLIFLVISILNMVRDLIIRRTGSRFQLQLLGYFSLIVLFAAVPVTIITSLSLTELVSIWKTIKGDMAMDYAHNFATDIYELKSEKFKAIVAQKNFDSLADLPTQNLDTNVSEDFLKDIMKDIMAVQDFVLQADGSWKAQGFLGEIKQELKSPPSLQPGILSFREMPRDTDIIRYVVYPRKTLLRVVTYHLGADFDLATNTINNEKTRFETINALGSNLKPFLIFYYGIFFFPILLMTLIIAISFTQRVTQPIVELTEATRQVAGGDFTINIIPRRNDELGLLIRSFNTMVKDLEQSQASLVKAEKISIWQTMAEQLAHEIKNPLTPIKLSAERVLRRWRNEPERIGEILEKSMLAVIQETEGLSTLLTEFRTLSRPLEPSLSWTKLRELTMETIAPYASSYPQVLFDITHLSPDISVKIDRHRLSQVLTNLIINGIDAMNGKGTIEIRTDLVKSRESRYCRISIKDTGKGMTHQEQSQIFTPYFTTKTSGTGLGLPIVERIVHDHGGSIWCNTAEQVGTTFFIDLPIDERRSTEP
jgi:nitrogen fixation/metabolism regulation signal transduction histidine kinase